MTRGGSEAREERGGVRRARRARRVSRNQVVDSIVRAFVGPPTCPGRRRTGLARYGVFIIAGGGGARVEARSAVTPSAASGGGGGSGGDLELAGEKGASPRLPLLALALDEQPALLGRGARDVHVGGVPRARGHGHCKETPRGTVRSSRVAQDQRQESSRAGRSRILRDVVDVRLTWCTPCFSVRRTGVRHVEAAAITRVSGTSSGAPAGYTAAWNESLRRRSDIDLIQID